MSEPRIKKREPRIKRREREEEEESQPEEPQKSAKKTKVNEETKERMFAPMDAIKIATTIFADAIDSLGDQESYDETFASPADKVFRALTEYRTTGCATKLLLLQETIHPFPDSESESESSKDDDEEEYPATVMGEEKRREEKDKARTKAKRKEHWVHAKCPKCENKEDPSNAVEESDKDAIKLSQASLAFIKKVLEAVEDPKGAAEYFLEQHGYGERYGEIMESALCIISRVLKSDQVEDKDRDALVEIQPDPSREDSEDDDDESAGAE